MSYLEGSHHIIGEYWSDPTGRTIRAVPEPHGILYRLATDLERTTLTAQLVDAQLQTGRGLYCPGCPTCEPRVHEDYSAEDYAWAVWADELAKEG